VVNHELDDLFGFFIGTEKGNFYELMAKSIRINDLFIGRIVSFTLL